MTNAECCAAVQLLPKGPTGLWGALALVSAPLASGRELPSMDLASVGSAPAMFDYDPSLATELDVAFDWRVTLD